MGLALGYSETELGARDGQPGVSAHVVLLGLVDSDLRAAEGSSNIAKVLPPYHVAQLALNAIHMGPYPNPVGVHVEALIGVTLLFLGLAAYGYWKDEGGGVTDSSATSN